MEFKLCNCKGFNLASFFAGFIVAGLFCLFVSVAHAEPVPQDTTWNSWALADSEWGNWYGGDDSSDGSHIAFTITSWAQDLYDAVESKKPTFTVTHETPSEKDLRCLCGWQGTNYDLIWEGGPYQTSAERCPDCLIYNHLYDPENGNLYKRYVLFRTWEWE